jgi:small-conductance mechanosensitive channel
MTRLLAGGAHRTDGRLTIANLAAEAGLTRQQAYRSPVIQEWRDATRDPPATEHPDKTQAQIDRLARDLAASQQRAQRYRQERDEARDQAKTLANASRALDEENQALRSALADARVISPLPRHADDDWQSVPR